jgi:quinolinate synthase
MYRIDLPHLCWALEHLAQGNVVNQIQVDAQTRRWATVALERMLAISASPAAGTPTSTAVAPVAGR